MVLPGLAVRWCLPFVLNYRVNQGWPGHQSPEGALHDLPCLTATPGGPICLPDLLPAWRVLRHHPNPLREQTSQLGSPWLLPTDLPAAGATLSGPPSLFIISPVIPSSSFQAWHRHGLLQEALLDVSSVFSQTVGSRGPCGIYYSVSRG